MINAGNANLSYSRPAGIILMGFQKESCEMPWHPCLTEVEDNLTAIEAAVLECATAGCESVWVCCDEKTQPLIKKRVGDYVRDPLQVAKSSFTKHPNDHQIHIPIYYYLAHPKDRHRRPGEAWSVINTALTIYHMAKSVSRWVIPNKYYVTFASGLYDFSEVKDYRDFIRKEGNISFQYDGKGVESGLYTGFSISGLQIKKIISHLKSHRAFGSTPTLSFGMISDILKDFCEKKIELEQYFNCNTWKDRVYYIKNRNYLYEFDRDYYFNKKSYGVNVE